MKKHIGMLTALTMLDVMMLGDKPKQQNYIIDEPNVNLKKRKVKPEIIPNGCDRYHFYGFDVIALNEKSAKKKCEKLYFKAYGRKP